MKDLNHYTVLAEMFRYPAGERNANFSSWREIIDRYDDPALKPKLESCILHFKESPLSHQQEYFIKTFDVQAICFLDVGYVMFGEDHRRAIFLLNIKNEQIKAGNQCGTELPDHLPNMLTLLPKMNDPRMAEELIFSVMIPVLERMISGFRSEINIYKVLLEILLIIMNHDYPVSDFERFEFPEQIKSPFNCPVTQDNFLAEK